MNGNKDEARTALEDFWKTVSAEGAKSNPLKSIPGLSLFTKFMDAKPEHSPLYHMTDFMTRVFSPYQLNPFNINPLRDILEKRLILMPCVNIHRSNSISAPPMWKPAKSVFLRIKKSPPMRYLPRHACPSCFNRWKLTASFSGMAVI